MSRGPEAVHEVLTKEGGCHHSITFTKPQLCFPCFRLEVNFKGQDLYNPPPLAAYSLTDEEVWTYGLQFPLKPEPTLGLDSKCTTTALLLRGLRNLNLGRG